MNEQTLPDEWDNVRLLRTRQLLNDTLSRGERFLSEKCIDCPAFRSEVYGIVMFLGCIFDKCIKRYPHKADNKEFT